MGRPGGTPVMTGRGKLMGLAAAILDPLDHVGDWGLLATDANLVVTRWNRWLEQRSGLAAADVIGRPLFDVFPDLVSFSHLFGEV